MVYLYFVFCVKKVRNHVKNIPWVGKNFAPNSIQIDKTRFNWRQKLLIHDCRQNALWRMSIFDRVRDINYCSNSVANTKIVDGKSIIINSKNSRCRRDVKISRKFARSPSKSVRAKEIISYGSKVQPKILVKKISNLNIDQRYS